MSKKTLKVKEPVTIDEEISKAIETPVNTKPSSKLKEADESDKLAAEGIAEAQSALMDWKAGYKTSVSGSALAIAGLTKLAIASDLHLHYLVALKEQIYLNEGEVTDKKARNQAYEQVFISCFGVRNYEPSEYRNEIAKLREVLPVVLMLVEEQNKFKKPVVKHSKDGVELLTMLAFDEDTDKGKAEVKKRKEYSEIDGTSLTVKALHQTARKYLGITNKKGAQDNKGGTKPLTFTAWLSAGKSLINDAENVTGSQVMQAMKIQEALEQFIEDNLELAVEFEAKSKS